MKIMAHVGGPTSLLPRARVPAPSGTPCDKHPQALAVARLIGEVDSIGHEAADLCQTCLDSIPADTSSEGICDHCSVVDDLTPTRDPEEGSCGPVYYCCKGCSMKLRQSFLLGVEPQSLTPHGYED